MTPDEARRQFPVLERIAYLNTGTFGPLARATVDAMQARLTRDLELGRAGKPYYDEVQAMRAEVRELLAGQLGVAAENVALTTSTTRACNIVVSGLRLTPEDEVVTTDSEHFGLAGPLHASGARVRVARVRDLPAADALDRILAGLGPATRLIALSHVSWVTGHILPLVELRAASDVPLLVDGAQSVGAIPVDAAPFDFYTVSGQKWLCGPDSTGALYVRDPERLDVAAPAYLSQESWDPDGSFVPRAGATRFDSDWMSLPSLAGLATAIASAPEWRFDVASAAASRCSELLVEAGLEVVTEPGHATLVTFRAEGDAEAAVARALDQGVVVRDMPGTDWIRASCGYWTNEDDLERLVAAVA